MERRSSDELVDQLLTRSFARRAEPDGVCPGADLLSAFVDGGLDQAERLQVTEHAAACSRCAQVLAIVVDPATTPGVLASPVPGRPWLGRWRWMVPIATAATVAGIWIATRHEIRPIVPRPPVTLAVPVESAVEPPSISPTPPETTGGRVVAVQPPARAVEQRSFEKSTTRTETVLPEARRERAESAGFARDQAPASEPSPPAPAAAPPPPASVAPLASPPPQAIAAPQDTLSARPPAQGQGRAGGAGGSRFAGGGVVGGVADQTVTVTGASPPVDVQAARQATSPPVIWRASGAIIESSTDEGRTWNTAYDAGRTVLARSTPAPEVGWFVGVRGLIVRRIGSTWSLVTAPANLDVVSVTVTNDRAATITLSDGRVFATSDAGTTWTPR